MCYRVSPITGLSPWYSGSEGHEQHFFQAVLRPGNVAIDVGANWGLHTLCFSRLVGCSGRVIAVEPFPPALRELEWHVAQNACSNVRIHSLAISDSEGSAFFFPGESPTTGKLLFEAGVSPPAHAIPVRTCLMDALVNEEAFRARRPDKDRRRRRGESRARRLRRHGEAIRADAAHRTPLFRPRSLGRPLAD